LKYKIAERNPISKDWFKSDRCGIEIECGEYLLRGLVSRSNQTVAGLKLE